jgi:phosphatidylethanolamine/phosphatidyl-N-methylethanolamine N-methyltransferase
MAAHLRRRLPGVTVIEGDARGLTGLIPREWHGAIGTVICGIPLVLLSLAQQRRFIDAIDAVAPGRGFLHYSYCITSPIPAARHGMTGRREAWTPLNFPPASLWRYTPSATATAAR